MQVEILYTSGCPGYAAAIAAVREVMRELRIAGEIRSTLVTGAGPVRRLDFSGSPTIRLNGRDVAPPAPGLGVHCRLYFDRGTCGAAPPQRLIRQAFLEAQRREVPGASD